MCRLQEERPESEAEALRWSPKGPGAAAKWTATKTAAAGAERNRHNTCDAVFESGWEPAQQFHKVASEVKGRVALLLFEARRAGTSSGAARQQTDSFVPVGGRVVDRLAKKFRCVVVSCLDVQRLSLSSGRRVVVSTTNLCGLRGGQSGSKGPA